MDLGITGRTALVTGGDSGIGWETARILLEEGCTVVLSDLDQESLDEAATKLDAPEGRLHAVAADRSTDEAAQQLATDVAALVGDIDILVQSAGITGAQGLFHEIDDAGWVDTINVDLHAPVRLTRAFIEPLRRGGAPTLIQHEGGIHGVIRPGGEHLMTWEYAQGKMMWGLFYLFPGGTAQGRILSETGTAE